MSATTHYNLPQWQEGENTDWFQLNGAFETIDTTMDDNKNAAENAQVSADGAQTAAESAQSTAIQNTAKIAEIESDLTALETKEAQDVATLSGNIQGNTSKINQLETGLNNLSQEQTSLATTVSGHTTQLGGITLSYEEGDYYAQAAGGVKKKLGENAILIGEDVEPFDWNLGGASMYYPRFKLKPLLEAKGLWKTNYTTDNFLYKIISATNSTSRTLGTGSYTGNYYSASGSYDLPIPFGAVGTGYCHVKFYLIGG